MTADRDRMSEELLRSLRLGPFRPLPPFLSGHAQTFAAAFWPQGADPAPSATHEIGLEDGDQLVLVENRPRAWKEGDRVAVLVHGLTGCHTSPYMSRLAAKLALRGMLVIRVNLRGCGPGVGKARLPYHNGRSEDTRAVIRWLAAKYPGSPVTQIGFSLGGNITLKMAGEDGASPAGNLDSVVAVSPPIDLEATAEKLASRRCWFYSQFFLNGLKRHARQLQERFPELGCPSFPRRMNLIDFDDLYTAPRSGFRDARDYYRRAASGPLLSSIRVPALILCSMDDPVLEVSSFARLPKIPGVDVVLTRHGGHVGFLGSEGAGLGFRWMDALILRWLNSRGITRS